MVSNRVRILILTACFLLILLFFTLPLWSGSRILFQGDVVNSAVTEYNYPARQLLSSALKSGGLPLWNSYIGCGFPQLAQGQSGMLYSLNLILFGALGSALAFNISIILSLLLSLIFSYLLFRHYDISRPASLFAATAFTFSAFVIAKLKFTYMVNSICWIPLALYGVERAVSRRNLAYLFLTTLALCMQLLAGGSQFFLITLSVVVVVFLWRFISLLLGREGAESPLGGRGALLLVLGIVLCLVLAAALAAPQLIPQAYGFPFSDRSTDLSFSWSLGTPMEPRNLVQFVSPYQFGNPARGTYDLDCDLFWENIAYPGLLTLVLALIALLFLSRKDRTIQMWVLIGCLALFLALGDNLPVAEFVWKYVPGFKLFRFWQRFLVLVVLSIAVLSGKGLDYVLSFFKRGRAWYAIMVLLILAVLLIDLGLFAYNQVSTIDADRIREDNPTVQWLRGNQEEKGAYGRVAVLGQGDVWKEALRQSGGWMSDKDLFYEYMDFLPPNQFTLFDIYGVNQYGDYGIYRFEMLDTLTNDIYLRQDEWQADINHSTVNVLAMEGARYLVTPFILDVEGLTLIEERETNLRGVELRIYKIDGSFPRTYINQEYLVLDISQLPFPRQLIETMWDYEWVRNRVILEEEPSLQYGPHPGGDARITGMDDYHVTIEVESPGGGILVLTDNYYPGWHVLVDGEESELLRVNYSFRGVELEPGEHLVEFVYHPNPLYHGIGICAFSLLLVLLIFLQHRRTGFLSFPPPVHATGVEGKTGISPSPEKPE
ncbi:MAG: YfhO family protein [Actinomycetota bacterium]|nr:YfhO family protein [Actinomycetota bacterium]